MDVEKQSASDTYLLTRDWMANARLSFQHQIIKEREGWLLYPKIQAELDTRPSSTTSSSLRIADVAAGNGIWAVQLLQEMPNAEFTLFDISDDAYPPAWTCPQNLKLETYNIFDPPPDKYKDYFDVVHMRLVLGVIHGGGRETVIKNLVSMLKPGGWLQWQDLYPPGQAPIDRKTLSPLLESEWPVPVQIIGDLTGVWRNTSFLNHLDEVLAAEGNLEDTELFKPPFTLHTLQQETELSQWVYSEFVRGPIGKMMNAGQRNEFHQKLNEEWDKITQGNVWALHLVVAVGRKSGGR